MKYYRPKVYFVYILTNKNRTVLYAGVTNNLGRRLSEHNQGKSDTFCGRYNVHYLLYWENFDSIIEAIRYEKRIKRMSRVEKEALINTMNPKRDFLNYLV